jgi:hypothetical protein
MKTLVANIVVSCVLGVTAVAQSAVLDTAARCTPISVESRANRVQVRCTTDSGTASFAVPTTNAGTAQRFMDIALYALTNNKVVTIAYQPNDLSGPNFGCVMPSCRPARAIIISQ